MANVNIGVEIDVERAKSELDSLKEKYEILSEAIKQNKITMAEWVSEGKDISELEKETKDLESQLDKVNTATKTLEENIGKTAKTNKGFVDSMSALPGPVGSAAKGFKGLTSAAKAFIATPIGAVLTAIVGVLAIFKTSLEATEEGQQKLAKITGTLKGVLVGLKEALVVVAPLIADIFSGNWSKIGDDWDKVKEAFGNISNIATQTGEISEARRKLQKETKEWQLTEAKLNGELAKNRAIYNDISKSEKEQNAANEKAHKTKVQIVNGQLALKRKEIALMQQEQSLSSNTQEDNEALIQLQIDEQNILNQLEEENERYAKSKNKIAKATKQNQKETETANKEELEKQKKHNTALLNLQKIKVSQLKVGTSEWLKEQEKLIEMTFKNEISEAGEDSALQQIAQENMRIALKNANDVAEAYENTLKKTYSDLANAVAPQMPVNQWEQQREEMENALDEIQDAIDEAYGNNLLSQQQYNELSNKLSLKRAAEEKKINKDIALSKIDMAGYATSAVIDSLVELSSVNASESKKMFDTNKKLQIAQATIEGIRAGIKIWADENAPSSVKAAETAALALSTAAAIAKIKKTKFSGTSSSSSSTSTSALSSGQTASTNSSITREIVYKGNDSAQTVLVVDDVTAAQNKAKRVKTISKI